MSEKLISGEEINRLFSNSKWNLFKLKMNIIDHLTRIFNRKTKKPFYNDCKTKFEWSQKNKRKFTRNTYIIEEEYILRKKVINIFEEEEEESFNPYKKKRNKPRSNNNNTPIKTNPFGSCFYSCFHSRRQQSEEVTPSTIRLNTSTDAQKNFKLSNSCVNGSEMTCYKDLFVENSDSSRYTLKRKSTKKISLQDVVNKNVEVKEKINQAVSITKFPISAEKKEPSTTLVATDETVKKPVVKDTDKDLKEIVEDITLDWVKSKFLNSEYYCDSFIGEGTFGKVFGCNIIKKNNERIAIKVNKKLEKYRRLAMHEISLLNRVKKHDPKGKNHIIILKDWFDMDGHIILVFPEYGENLYKYLKFNNHIGIKLKDVRHMSIQLWTAVKYLHSLTIIHTDLKPENLLLVSKDYQYSTSNYSLTKMKILTNADIVLIDLGNGISENDVKPKVIVTRYYRAPEIYLELEWDESIDVWSIGCVMFELYTGRSLFQCRADVEHLWMIQYVLKKFPQSLIQQSKVRDVFFNATGYVLTENLNINKLKMRLRGFEYFVKDPRDEVAPLIDLISKCLKYNPKERIKTHEALLLPFLS